VTRRSDNEKGEKRKDQHTPQQSVALRANGVLNPLANKKVSLSHANLSYYRAIPRRHDKLLFYDSSFFSFNRDLFNRGLYDQY
jgi:hypothetical protein